MKDYKKIQESTNNQNEITSKEIKELGYSQYDINTFIESGILIRLKRGIYQFVSPTLEQPQIIEPIKEEVSNESIVKTPDPNVNYISTGISFIIRRESTLAREEFKKQLILTPENNKALYGVLATYIFEQNYQEAYSVLKELIGKENLFISPNYYACLMMLQEYVDIDEEELKILYNRVIQVPVVKMGQNTKKMIIALQNKDYLDAFRFMNYNISFDKKARKYHLTNQVIRFLCQSILKDKGLYVEKEAREIISASTIIAESKTMTEQVESPKESPVVEANPILEEETIIVPQVTEQTILPNLLIESINNNDYERALSILENSSITNPEEIIRTLLTKLHMLKSLLTTTEPIKVTQVEPVRIVEETKKDIIEEDLTEIRALEETETLEVTETQPTTEELMNIAYKAYKDTFCIENFEEALKNLRRYDYLSSKVGTKRNINYHYIRIEACSKDYKIDPETYVKKRDMASKIFDLKKNKKYSESLSLIEEYKQLPGYKSPNTIICEAEIYYIRNDFKRSRDTLRQLGSCEEPTYYYLMAHLNFKENKLDEALQNCIAYNERRPRTTIGIYVLMGDIYKKKGKAGKAVKTYRIAEEIGKSAGKNLDNIQSKISSAENQSEIKRNLRLGKNY